ncbi:hypothetical protein B6N60_01252 [Richelia sinica FACHB-800]|uniref:Uncharacterized protein n=1 Tax=Richelia sinica FACHB-800 TaxID=1357546 RepID=A0A975T5T1_9NOST|nr:hypothetical protein [Richelia sinica FACHB-800]QXE22569.1 hypothetical protein B6N60_01252 [Richelia sinica FACHB-800]
MLVIFASLTVRIWQRDQSKDRKGFRAIGQAKIMAKNPAYSLLVGKT